jgi:hypothetical protein
LNGVLTIWVKTIDSPSLSGWATTVGYILAALLCIRAALVRKCAGVGESVVWRSSAGVLVFLGVNKQLDFQTLLIVIGRAAAQTEGWYDDRRIVQKLFVGALALAFMGLVWWAVTRHGFFLRNHRLAAVGLGLVLIYGLLRAAEIDHLELSVSSEPADQPWLWIIEVTGVMLCILGAARGCRAFASAAHKPRGSGRQSAPSRREGNQGRLTSGATVQGFNAQSFVSRKSHPDVPTDADR